jgi:hypothetical protein
MPFEPLQTDEKIEGPIKRKRDMDAAMLFGCSGFVFSSIAGYILSVWPFLVFPDSERISSLSLAAGTGLIPAAIVGIAATRKFALAGACGFVGGALSTGIFLYLRIEQTFIAALARQAPTPEYPRIMTYLIPLCWILISAILALIFLPREQGDTIE